MALVAMRWHGDGLVMLDQRRLPTEEVWVELRSWREVAKAIEQMVVRGAPAIGVAAAYGMALAARAGEDWNVARAGLAASRPTAVNLFWALDRLDRLSDKSPESVAQAAQQIESEDRAMNEAIGVHGAELVPAEARILTICNTGSLATAGHGTALGIIRTAWAQGKVKHVYSCETRPRQQGLRLTAFELMHDEIPFHSIVDSAAASLMQKGQVDWIVAGADRIAANGDTANKIGTYMLAVLAHHHKIPFVIAAPSSTLDPLQPTGSSIPIEERAADEITEMDGVRIAPAGCPVWNPGFDVTPGELIHAIVTEGGVWRRPYAFRPGDERAEPQARPLTNR
ncbi:MAG TPA: S-methyl-5-thioribose-1-phosphate isomerase [Fimbriimonadaceae bacterium]|nr:S-methyl-5-thioribose-1-phosphate isomerase [Fimbriimonadaceae bacterium]